MELLKKARSGAFYAACAGLTIVLLFPVLWMVLCSGKSQIEISSYPPSFLFVPTLSNYEEVLTSTSFLRNTFNSLSVTAGSLLVSLAVGLPAAYGIARYRLRKISLLILLVRMFPFITFLIPWFQMFQSLGLTDTRLALILTHIVIVLPLVVWVTMSFFEDIPRSYDEAGFMDGCSKFGVFVMIALPLAAPGIVAASILASVFSWNNLMFALVLGGHETKTLPVAIQNFMSFEELQWGQLCAVASLITLPIILIVLFLQKNLVQGLSSGGLKG